MKKKGDDRSIDICPRESKSNLQTPKVPMKAQRKVAKKQKDGALSDRVSTVSQSIALILRHINTQNIIISTTAPCSFLLLSIHFKCNPEEAKNPLQRIYSELYRKRRRKK